MDTYSVLKGDSGELLTRSQRKKIKKLH